MKLSPEVRLVFARIGRKGGKAKSVRKTNAARANIRKRWAMVRAKQAA